MAYLRWVAGVLASAAAVTLAGSAAGTAIPSAWLPYIGLVGTIAGIIVRSPLPGKDPPPPDA